MRAISRATKPGGVSTCDLVAGREGTTGAVIAAARFPNALLTDKLFPRLIKPQDSRTRLSGG
jgi:hypothetical protein